LSPTYRLLIGVPGRSNAFEIARRLGLSEEIIQTSRQLMSGESQSVEEMIGDLDRKRKLAEQERDKFRAEWQEAKNLHEELAQAYDEWQNEQDNLRRKAEEKANKIVEKAQQEAEKVIDELRQKQLQGTDGQAVKEHEFIEARTRLSQMRTEEEEALASNKVLKKAKEKQVLKEGDAVFVATLGQKGTLVEKVSKNEWTVQMGSLKMKLPEKALQKTEQEQEEQKTVRTVRGSAPVPMQLDLRGMRYEEALKKLDQYMDAAMLANYPKVTIIHGVGTGVIRKGVQDALKKYPFVASYNIAPANQGGAGATEVTFK